MAGGAADVGLGFLRLTGLGLAYHGYQKVFGGDMSDFAGDVKKIGFPAPIAFAWAAALSELVGGALVAIGLYTRVAAALAAATMFVAAFLALPTEPFKGERELALAYLVATLALACLGAGKWSIDGMARKSA